MKKYKKPVIDLFNWMLVGGLLITLPVLISQHWQTIENITFTDWLAVNLGYSAIAFILVVILFFYYLWQQQIALNHAETAPDKVQHLDNLTELMMSLSFGIGVIWTAIGMRNALASGLDGVGSAMAETGNAFEILERLVEGGLLVALSTTIVGGVLGYLLRIIKSILLGRKLNNFYHQLDNQHLIQLSADVALIRKNLLESKSPEKGASKKTTDQSDLSNLSDVRNANDSNDISELADESINVNNNVSTNVSTNVSEVAHGSS